MLYVSQDYGSPLVKRQVCQALLDSFSRLDRQKLPIQRRFLADWLQGGLIIKTACNTQSSGTVAKAPPPPAIAIGCLIESHAVKPGLETAFTAKTFDLSVKNQENVLGNIVELPSEGV